ncbi:MAG: hypothetical protein ABSA92_04820 [Candidatus Bathyarchaeia archaeon]
MSKLETVGRFFDNLKKLDYDEKKALQQLSTINDLETEIKQLGEKRDNLKKTFEQEEKQLAQLQKDVIYTRNTFSQVNEEKIQADIAWLALSEKIKQGSYRIEFAEALCQLFEERVLVSPKQIVQLQVGLQRIYETALKHVGYAIDYSQARETVISLLESAIGKGVVLHEQYDKAVKQHDDLMLDKLGKMEKERDKLDKLKAVVEQVSREKLIQTAIYQKLRGRLTREYTCPKCKVIMVHSMTESQQHLVSCPFCQPSLSSNYNADKSFQQPQN